jgi:Uma2 family endonuclease
MATACHRARGQRYEALVRDVEQIDLAQFPPPDLAVEVDITSSSLDRFSLYTDFYGFDRDRRVGRA